jgi:LPXTG-motif cell wall-anchored protein
VRARVAALAMAVLTAGGMLAAFTPGQAVAQNSFGAFQAYANGTKQHARIVDANGQTLANVDTSFSGATANSNGLAAPVNNVFNEPVQPAQAGKNSYARSAAAEVGLGNTFPSGTDPSQIILPSLLEAAAAPTTGLLTKNLIDPIQGNPLLYISAATDKSQAVWNDNFCPIGQPISYGENDLANAQLINTGSTPFPNGSPLVSVTPSGDFTQTNFNQSYTYLYPTGPSTFGLGAVNRQVLAPLTIGKDIPTPGTDLAVVTLLGTWQLRVEDSGNGAPTVTYAAYDNLGNKLQGATPVATITIAGMPVIEVTAQQVFGANGFTLDLPPGNGPKLLHLQIGGPPTAIAGKTNGFTTDAVRLTVLSVPGTITVGDVAYGHMEAQAQAPAGGISCNIPVTKTFNDASGNPVSSLASGNNFTWKITFPSVDISKELACDLTNIKVTDVAKVVSGSSTVNITGASNGGNVTGSVVKPGTNGGVTWSLPTYHPGDPPVVLTITGTIPPTSQAGVITNTVNVNATLGNCTGGALGKAFVTNGSVGGQAATIQGSAFTGVGAATTSLTGPQVKAGLLATTGQKNPWLPVLGGGFLLGALALMRSRRRLQEAPSEARF